jgi:hypothetical protein
MDETWIHIHKRSWDQGTIQGMETQWFLEPKEVHDTYVAKQGVAVCFLEQKWSFACMSRLPGNGCNNEVKAPRCILQTEAGTGLQT